jgi:hypothetical protein
MSEQIAGLQLCNPPANAVALIGQRSILEVGA